MIQPSTSDLCTALIIAHDRMQALSRALGIAEAQYEELTQKLRLDVGTICTETGHVLRPGIDKIICGDRLIDLNTGYHSAQVTRANVLVIGHPAMLELKP